MTIPDYKNAAVVYLPAVSDGRLSDTGLRRWLARSELVEASEPEEILRKTLGLLNLPCPEGGLGALRMWGQTGDRPTVWIAAADPVYLEPRLDHLCLHALADSVPANDLRPLLDHLQQELAGESDYGFARVGTLGYLRAEEPIATAAVPSHVVHLQMPNEYLPDGPKADAHRSLTSEVEMALHDHEVNSRRQEQGLRPVNSLWFWGGGYAPEQHTEPRPPLFGDEPLLRGHWLSRTAVAEPWPGSIAACLEASIAGFVAVVPEADDANILQSCLSELREALHSGRLLKLHLVFRDGIEATVEAGHRWRFWRLGSKLLDTAT